MIFQYSCYRKIAIPFIIFLVCYSHVTFASEDHWKLLTQEEQNVLLGKLAAFQRSIKTFHGKFLEKKSTRALKSPLQFEGRIYYDAEGLFFMHYLEPVRHILRVKGGEALFFV